MRVLITRPMMDADRTAERLRALGHHALIDPVIEIEPLVPQTVLGEDFAGLVFTSANAARIAAKPDVLKPLLSLPVFAVGTHTAEVARDCGFQNVAAAAGDVNALGELLAASLPAPSRVLHVAGEDRAGDLPAALVRAHIGVETLVIYRARASAALRDATRDALRSGRIDAVLHFSPRSAALFVQLADAAGRGGEIRALRHFCLSAAVAEPLKAFGASVEIASAPDEAALLELLGP